jgi:hypothetical protein
MKIRLLLFVLLITLHLYANSQQEKWLRAFPITGYIIDLTDSTKLVQIEMPDGIKLKEKQPGLLRGVYTDKHSDTVLKGYGRCYLIKENFYYFSINTKNSVPIKEGDLLYTIMDKTEIVEGQIPQLASHFIRLQSVYDEPFYDRYLIFNKWTELDEKALLDSMMKDIRFTGNYFLENEPSMNVLIDKGTFKGEKVLQIMSDCKINYIVDFFDYIIARPRLYAGRNWKVSEIFATWLTEGAPTVIKK